MCAAAAAAPCRSVLWGRSVFTSIRKFLQFQLTVNFVALVVSFVGALVGGRMPLNVLQVTRASTVRIQDPVLCWGSSNTHWLPVDVWLAVATCADGISILLKYLYGLICPGGVLLLMCVCCCVVCLCVCPCSCCG
jgi:hypothetical protein